MYSLAFLLRIIAVNLLTKMGKRKGSKFMILDSDEFGSESDSVPSQLLSFFYPLQKKNNHHSILQVFDEFFFQRKY